MAISQFPPSKPRWVELASSTPTSGTSVSFSSLAAYSVYRVTYMNVDLSGTGQMTMRLNNDSTSSYATSFAAAGQDAPVIVYSLDTSFILDPSVDSNNHFADIIIDNVSGITSAKGFTGQSGTISAGTNSWQGFWNGNTQINRIDILSTQAFSGSNTGVIKIYGQTL